MAQVTLHLSPLFFPKTEKTKEELQPLLLYRFIKFNIN